MIQNLPFHILKVNMLIKSLGALLTEAKLRLYENCNMDFHSFVSVTSMVAASLVALLTSPVSSSPVSGSAILNERAGKNK
jgi:hypothetical protein